STTRAYGYSPPGFLTSSTDAGDSQTVYGYGFDSFGLPTSITRDAVRRDFVFDGDTLIVGGVTYRFDGLGRVIQKGPLRLRYGPNGHLKEASNDVSTWSFVTDELGQRILKRTSGVTVAGYVAGDYLDNTGLTQPVRLGGILVGLIQPTGFRVVP